MTEIECLDCGEVRYKPIVNGHYRRVTINWCDNCNDYKHFKRINE